MNIITIKNHVSDSLLSLGLTVRKATEINQDAGDYILMISNMLEQSENIPMGRKAQTVLTCDISCSSKEESTVQSVMAQVYELVTSQDFLVSFSPSVPVSTITVISTIDDIDPTSGINTLMITLQFNYLTR
jgi:hypothetical protein